jgi:hypothetical protein
MRSLICRGVPANLRVPKCALANLCVYAHVRVRTRTDGRACTMHATLVALQVCNLYSRKSSLAHSLVRALPPSLPPARPPPSRPPALTPSLSFSLPPSLSPSPPPFPPSLFYDIYVP